MVTVRHLGLLCVVAVLLIGLVCAFLALGPGGTKVSNGEAVAYELEPVEDVSREISGVGYSGLYNMGEDERPPESTLGVEGQKVRAAGEVIGSWEPERWFSGPFYNSKSWMHGSLPLSSGEVLEVSGGESLEFRYGDEVGPGDVFDALAFKVGEGELFRHVGEDGLEVSAGRYGTPAPVGLQVEEQPANQRTAEVATGSLEPGVYVISVLVSVGEGDARYNYRVLVG